MKKIRRIDIHPDEILSVLKQLYLIPRESRCIQTSIESTTGNIVLFLEDDSGVEHKSGVYILRGTPIENINLDTASGGWNDNS